MNHKDVDVDRSIDDALHAYVALLKTRIKLKEKEIRHLRELVAFYETALHNKEETE